MTGPAPRAIYRLQLSAQFRLDDAAALVEQLDALGVSHLYLSPVLAAAPGSRHGYDVVDPNRVSEELGGIAGLQRLADAAHARGMGLLLDVVPNHMAADPEANPWWRDVLEDGRLSPFARVFDIDWDTPDLGLRGRVMLPLLDEELSDLVAEGGIRAVCQGARVTVACGERRLPLAPAALASVLERAAEPGLVEVAARLRQLHQPDPTDQEGLRRRRAERLEAADRLAAGLGAGADVELQAGLDRLNADAQALLELLGAQNWLLAHWREASWRVNYRRFFSIAGLVGVRIEDAEVHELTHALVADLVDAGVVDALRVDHVDGLRDPRGYLQRLAGLGAGWTVVEKILGPREQLPDWPVAGTTGYEAGAMLTQLFTDPSGEEELTALDEELTGEPWDPAGVAARARAEVMAGELAADVERLVRLLQSASPGVDDLAGRSRDDQRSGLAAVLAAMPVYRTYVDPMTGAANDVDRAVVAAAVAEARRTSELDESLLWALESLLCGAGAEPSRELVARFQQVSPAVMAKGVEDTALYRLLRLASLAEVGGSPERFGAGVDAFHTWCAAQARRPRTLVSTSTHDSKRSEDVRARLGVLSELSGQWAAQVRHWRERNRGRGVDDGRVEHLLYQLMVGAHPLSRDRAWTAIRKSVREAKLRTSWTDVDPGYESGLLAFLDSLYADSEFMSELETFAEPVARWGRLASLAQTLLKLTIPGVPDLYWGNELLEFRLVDPDNRGPVDFELRARLIRHAAEIGPEEAMADEAGGLAKLFTIMRALDLRRRRPEPFAAEYRALTVTGVARDHVVAFARGAEPEVVTVVPRLVAAGGGVPHDAAVELPEGRWRDQLSGDELDGGETALGTLLRRMPVALLSRLA